LRLTTFRTGTGQPRVGLALADGAMLDLHYLAARDPAADKLWATDMVELIAGGETALAWLKAQAAATPAPGAVVAAGAYELLAPIPRPRKNIFCVGLNYRDHVAEHDNKRKEPRALPTIPVFFSKPPTCVIGEGADIPWHPVTDKLDYEIELALVIGPGGKDIPAAEAWQHVWGLTILNDVSARDLQAAHGGQWFKGKGLDGACPLGPWIVHCSAITDPANLDFVSKVNGQVRQKSNTSMMIFDVPTIIESLSAGLTLEAGDIVAMGTCSGVGAGFEPPRFLADGDLVEMTIEQIGTLTNRVRRVARG